MADLVETSHESFKLPTNKDIKIWRYMDLAKYIAILQTKGLFFPRASLLGDPFEGSATVPMVQWREHALANKATDPALAPFNEMNKDQLRKFFSTLSSHFRTSVASYLTSCWHMNEHESAAMWSIYSRSNEAVCLQSTYRRLRTCLPQCVFIGEVRYIDYERESFSWGNVFNFIMHKRKSFEHERELRAIFWAGGGDEDEERLMEKMGSEGLWIPVELPNLIESVYVSPMSPAWFADVVTQVTSKYGLGIVPRQSALARAPLY